MILNFLRGGCATFKILSSCSRVSHFSIHEVRSQLFCTSERNLKELSGKPAGAGKKAGKAGADAKRVAKDSNQTAGKKKNAKADKDGLKKQATNAADKKVNLPKFPIPLCQSDAKLFQRELNVRETFPPEVIYEQQANDASRSRTFVLHDGPPYANGEPHAGHALNKILKDVVTRYRILKGDRVHFTPGWDCHGLPIELKATQQIGQLTGSGNGKDGEDEAMRIRQAARACANEFITRQGDAFRSWFVVGDWRNPYRTFSTAYSVAQLRAFAKMLEAGLLYRDLLPCWWSPTARTALAEAEIEYNDAFRSDSAFVRFELRATNTYVRELLQKHVKSGVPSVFAVAWTTTPWTLITNKAIAYSPTLPYSVVHVKSNESQFYLVASFFTERFRSMLPKDCESEVIASGVDGRTLFSGCAYRPLTMDRNEFVNIERPFIEWNAIEAGKGTGLVHINPAHGFDDFALWRVSERPQADQPLCIVDADAQFSLASQPLSSPGPELSAIRDFLTRHNLLGTNVLGEGNQRVIEALEKTGALLQRESYVHSYPIDWRTKKPLLVRPSTQWFIDIGALRTDALAAYERVSVRPAALRRVMIDHLHTREHWCISRQRCWGVPIPVFYVMGDDSGDAAQLIASPQLVEHICRVFADYERTTGQSGVDAWWKLRVDELLDDDSKRRYAAALQSNRVRKSTDIMDIWLDSGLSWHAVLGAAQADVYIEGYDQFRGWFQSSLLLKTALGLADRRHAIQSPVEAPYRALAVHGFTVDEHGKKLSKSAGNYVAPADICEKHGTDVLRGWAAGAGLDARSELSSQRLAEARLRYSTLRDCVRFILGNVSDLPLDYSVGDLLPFDAYLVRRVGSLVAKCDGLYDQMDYASVLNEIDAFISAFVSRHYFAAVKTRVYCCAPDSHARRSSQVAMRTALRGLLSLAAPIYAHLADEAHGLLGGSGARRSVVLGGWPTLPTADDSLARDFDTILGLKTLAVEAITQSRGTSFELEKAQLRVLVGGERQAADAVREVLDKYASIKTVVYGSQLTEVLRCASVGIESAQSDAEDWSVLRHGESAARVRVLVDEVSLAKCKRCRRFCVDRSDLHCQVCNLESSKF